MNFLPRGWRARPIGASRRGMRGQGDIAWLGREAGFAFQALARIAYEHLPDRLRRWLWQLLRREPAVAAPADLPPPTAVPAPHGAILVLDQHTPRLAQDAASLATVELMRGLIDLGYAPRFAAVRGAPYLAQHTEALRRIGVLTRHPPHDPTLAQHLAPSPPDIAPIL